MRKPSKVYCAEAITNDGDLLARSYFSTKKDLKKFSGHYAKKGVVMRKDFHDLFVGLSGVFLIVAGVSGFLRIYEHMKVWPIVIWIALSVIMWLIGIVVKYGKETLALPQAILMAIKDWRKKK